MEKIRHISSDFVVFKPTGKVVPVDEIKKTHDEFYHGDLTEDFAEYCAHEAVHAFWINYKVRGKKVRKEIFCKKFKEIVNEMLNEI